MVKVLKRFLPLLLVLLLLPASSLAAYVVQDDANLFTQEEELLLSIEMKTISKVFQIDLIVLTSYDAPTGKSQEFADDYYDSHNYGNGADKAGLLYLIDMHNRRPVISTSGAMIDYINDRRLERLFDVSYNELKKGNYAKSTSQLISQLHKYMDEGLEKGHFRYDSETGYRLTSRVQELSSTDFWIAGILGFVVMGVVAGTVAFRYGLKGSTYRYDRSNIQRTLAIDHEQFLRQTVVRRRNPPPPTSTSGRSGGGSGVHVSSSGHSHGGGVGRSF